MSLVKTRLVCTRCRKSFSERNFWKMFRQVAFKRAQTFNHTSMCPTCKQGLDSISCSIKIPKQKDVKGWNKIKTIINRKTNQCSFRIPKLKRRTSSRILPIFRNTV